MTRRGGFRLAELAAVIVILVVVAAILYPVFQQPGPRRAPSCLGNVKQLGTGMMMYAQDNDETFPPENVAQIPGLNWDDLLFHVLRPRVALEGAERDARVAQVFRCPDAKTPWNVDAASGRVRHYALNARVYGKNLSEIRFPASTVALCEVRYRVRVLRYRVPLAVTGPDGENGNDPGGWKPLGEPAALRHTGKSNYLFADGHAKWFPPEAVLDSRSPNDGKNPCFGL